MLDYSTLTKQILLLAPQFGFLEANIAQIKIDESAQNEFNLWLSKNFHGEMFYLERNTELRFNPAQLHDGTVSVICVKVPYLTKPISYYKKQSLNPNLANISSYALGRDYHKVVKQQLKQYALKINDLIADYQLQLSYRCFTDSAPVLEVELATKSGLGWRGKNTLLLNKTEGSMYFLGELFTNLPLTLGSSVENHCGSCSKCIDLCPTKAFIEPYLLDARRCISYLTIENQGSIPIEFRKAIGNRIYGCDECQLVCPWNKFSQMSELSDFNTRNNLDHLSLIEVFSWDEQTWQKKMQGSAILRIGYNAWLRNIAVALGNAPTSKEIINALLEKQNHYSDLVQEHIRWALEQHLT